MDLLRVAVTSLASLAAMFLLTKLMGNKQVSQMNLFDYVIGITIGSIAAEMATEMEESVWVYFTALAVYGLASWTHRKTPCWPWRCMRWRQCASRC